jgi:hypothetical protein
MFSATALGALIVEAVDEGMDELKRREKCEKEAMDRSESK